MDAGAVPEAPVCEVLHIALIVSFTLEPSAVGSRYPCVHKGTASPPPPPTSLCLPQRSYQPQADAVVKCRSRCSRQVVQGLPRALPPAALAHNQAPEMSASGMNSWRFPVRQGPQEPGLPAATLLMVCLDLSSVHTIQDFCNCKTQRRAGNPSP